jgi:hypothetical protein
MLYIFYVIIFLDSLICLSNLQATCVVIYIEKNPLKNHATQERLRFIYLGVFTPKNFTLHPIKCMETCIEH